MSEVRTVAILGGGSFGTAMAQLLGRKGYNVRMWIRKGEVRDGINQRHVNPMHLTKVTLADSVTAHEDLESTVQGASLVAVGLPTPALRQVFMEHRATLPVKVPIVLLSKGIEVDTLLSPIEILREELPGKYSKYVCAVSGPSFAAEIATGKPTNVTCASEDKAVCAAVAEMMGDRYFRVYTTNDVMGVEYAGALKNVIAIAAGISDGLDMGCNGRAAIITRGLAEMSKIAIAKGGNPLTMLSLAGVGDLMLTCTASQSRNYTVGYRLGKGETMEEIRESMTEVAEGVFTAKSLHSLTQELGLSDEMPICEQVYEVIWNAKSVSQAVGELMDRTPGEELDHIVNLTPHSPHK